MDHKVTRLLKGDLWATQATTGTLASAGTEIYGIQIGSAPVMYRERTYQGTCSQILVQLYEEGFTGGNLTPTTNRSFENTTGVSPANHYSGISRAGGGILRTSILILGDATTGNANAITPDIEFFILKANTQYVLVITNQGTSSGFVNFRFNYQRADQTSE